jgi:hypothetical protein
MYGVKELKDINEEQFANIAQHWEEIVKKCS